MELILWRHAEAEDGDGRNDLARELTRRGRKHAETMAAWLKPRLEGDWRVIVSPAKRTLQTVAPLAIAFEVSEAVTTDVPAQSVLREAGWPSAGGNVLVVGHQPTLGEVAAFLLRGRPGGVAMKKGAVWWFTTRERGGQVETVLKTVIDPDTAAE